MGKGHIDTPIKALSPINTSPIMASQRSDIESARMNMGVKKNGKAGANFAQGSNGDLERVEELQTLVFRQKEEIRRLKALIEENQNNSDLSVNTQDAEKEL